MIDLLFINQRMMGFTNDSMVTTGVLQIATYIRDKGFRTKVIDNNSCYKEYTFKDYVKFIEENDVQMIGLSVSTLNAYNSYNLAQQLRARFPKKIILGGGLHSYDAPKEMVEQTFDYVFKGEAEISLTRFMDSWKRGIAGWQNEVSLIPGILYKRDGKVIDTGKTEIISNLDEIPDCDFSILNLSDYIKTKYDHHAVTNNLNWQRGCPFRCAFCDSEVLASPLRNCSPEVMVRQLKARYEKYGLSNFFFTDSNFTINKKRLEEFCSLMHQSGLAQKVTFMIQTSITIPISDAELEMLKGAGCTMFLIGVERFTDDSRKIISKSGTQSQAVTLIRRLAAHGIKSICNILVNFPFETEDVLRRESAIIDSVYDDVGFIYINLLSPMPGTPVYDEQLDAKWKQWYLLPEVANYKLTYYDLAFLVKNPLSLKLNCFNLSKDVVTHLRKFKEHYQLKGSIKASPNQFVKAVVLADIGLGIMSYWVAKVSPALEDFLFGPLKWIRIKGYKAFFNIFVAQKHNVEKKGDGGAMAFQEVC